LREVLAACAFPVGAVALLFGRNYLLTADLRGGNAYQVHEPWSTVFMDLLHGLESLVGFEWKSLMRGRWTELVMVAGTAGLGLLLWIARPGRRSPRSKPPLEILFPGIYVGVSLVAILWLEHQNGIGLSERMLLPL